MPVVGTVYPSLETLMNLVRVRVNDTFSGITGTPGEGRILTDDNPSTLPMINAALSKYQRDLDNSGVARSTKTIFLLNVPPINSLLGVGQSNPATFQKLSYSGFYDGLENTQTPFLPPDLIAPRLLRWRVSGTNLTFAKFDQAPDGLPSVLQNQSPGMWEWSNDQISWNGPTQTTDYELRYTNLIQFYDNVASGDFPTTQLPFRESVDCLAYLIAADFCEPRLPPGACVDLLAHYTTEIGRVINRQVKAKQSVRYSRGGFGEDGDGGGYGGWGP